MFTLLRYLVAKLLTLADLQTLSEMLAKVNQLLAKRLVNSPIVKPVLTVYFYTGQVIVVTWLDLGFAVLWSSLMYAALLL